MDSVHRLNQVLNAPEVVTIDTLRPMLTVSLYQLSVKDTVGQDDSTDLFGVLRTNAHNAYGILAAAMQDRGKYMYVYEFNIHALIKYPTDLCVTTIRF